MPLGAARGFSAYLLGDTPSGRAVITGVAIRYRVGDTTFTKGCTAR